MLEFEIAGAGACVVGTEALNGLGFFVGGEEACRGNIVVEIDVDDRGRDDGYEAYEQEDAREGLVRRVMVRKDDWERTSATHGGRQT